MHTNDINTHHLTILDIEQYPVSACADTCSGIAAIVDILLLKYRGNNNKDNHQFYDYQQVDGSDITAVTKLSIELSTALTR